jgi:hypothetical protein
VAPQSTSALLANNQDAPGADTNQAPPIAASPTNAPDSNMNTNSANPFDQRGSNVVFVLDRSMSMKDNSKSTVARQDLVNTLRNLGTNKTFYVLFFPYTHMPGTNPLPATKANIDSMTNWIFSTSHSIFGSNPDRAMMDAFKMKPDTIWLLSDGEFSTNVVQAIDDANDPLHASINTVGFYSREGEPVLRKIAEDNHGTYRFVPPPNVDGDTNAVPSGKAPS